MAEIKPNTTEDCRLKIADSDQQFNGRKRVASLDIFRGLTVAEGYSHAPDKLTFGVGMKKIRWCGILQRIAFAYLIVALVEIFTKDAQKPGWISKY